MTLVVSGCGDNDGVPRPTPTPVVTATATRTPTPTGTITPGPVEPAGAGNAQNYGFATSADPWTFYDFLVFDLDLLALYRLPTDGSAEATKIGEPCLGLHVVGDPPWLYCTDGEKLVRMRLDGSERATVYTAEHPIETPMIDGEWLYFLGRTSGLGELNSGLVSRVRLDGTGYQQLADDEAYVMGVGEGWVFFRSNADDKLYRIRPDGSGRQQILDDAVDSPMTYAGNLYFIDYSRTSVAVSALDGSGLRDIVTFASGDIEHINIANNWLYFSRRSLKHPAKEGLFRVRLDGTDEQTLKVFDDDVINVPYISIAGPKVYAVNFGSLGGLPIPISYYRMNLDGSDFELMWEIQ